MIIISSIKQEGKEKDNSKCGVPEFFCFIIFKWIDKRDAAQYQHTNCQDAGKLQVKTKAHDHG
jgi:hypothetical protein